MQNQELEPSVEVAHLRRLLDTQPSCLMRLGADGTVLAANDAALALLGVPSGAQALGRNFTVWVATDQRDQWSAFTSGVVEGHSASIECDIAAPTGVRQPMLFHGVPLADHPDGVRSLAVAARAVSGQRQLEATVVELEEQLRERDTERLKARARLAEAEESRRQLAEKVDALETRLREQETARSDDGLLRQLRADLEAQDAALAEAEESRRQLAEKVDALETRLREQETARSDDGLLRQLRADLEARDAALAEAEAARRVAEAQAAQARADLQQLELALDGFAARQKQMAAERAAERQRLQEMSELLAARHEQELAAARNDPEKARLAARLQEREATVRALEQSWAEQQAALEQAQTHRTSLEAAVQEAQGAAAAAGQREREARAEHAAMTAQLGDALAACRQREEELHERVAAHAALAAAHEALKTEHERFVGALREQAARLGALAGGGSLAAGASSGTEDPAEPDACREEERA